MLSGWKYAQAELVNKLNSRQWFLAVLHYRIKVNSDCMLAIMFLLYDFKFSSWNSVYCKTVDIQKIYMYKHRFLTVLCNFKRLIFLKNLTRRLDFTHFPKMSMNLDGGCNRNLSSLVGSGSKTLTFSEFRTGDFLLINARTIHIQDQQNLEHQGTVQTCTGVALTAYKGRTLIESPS